MIICVKQNSAGLEYAAGEIKKLFSEFTTAVFAADGGDRVITLEIDLSMLEHDYRISGNGTELDIRGGNASSVLCGVYEALADAGIFFQATGYSVPKTFDTDTFFSVNKAVHPKFRLRGIRQHINFTMDISSYALKEAQEYIRNLARMRYNAITFHTYPGQWHETRPDDPTDFAGHFFYGQVHSIPKDEPLITERVKNRKYYCIPEVEAIFENDAARGEYAKYWLNQVMKTAKEAGLTITLSVEITNDDREGSVKMLNTILKTYPLVDVLELITLECGGFSETPGLTIEGLKDYMINLFGTVILDENGDLPGMPKELPGQLGSSAVCLKRILDAAEDREKWLAGLDHVPELRGGLYLTCTDTLRVLRPILRSLLPKGMTFSLLPAHGALAAADNIEKTGTLSEDWQNTMFYSWAEFDGNMYIQQLSTDGIEKLTTVLPDTDSSYGFAINHWRTSENNLTISYAAESGISAVSLKEYYKSYADKLGIGDVEGFVNTCTKLAWLDTYNRDNLFNIGFCAVGCWLAWHRNGDAMRPRGYHDEHQICSIAEYEALMEEFRKVLASAETREGIAFIRLMINRCEASAVYVRSHLTLNQLEKIYDFDALPPVTEDIREKALAVIGEAKALAMKYLEIYGEMLPDRGGEGQLISYYETMIVYINAVEAYFIGKKTEHEELYDAPPMPDADAK